MRDEVVPTIRRYAGALRARSRRDSFDCPSLNELNSDHGSWVYEGASGVSLSAAAAWFRVHLMNDTANRKYFYGANCTFCNDNRVDVEQNSLMAQ